MKLCDTSERSRLSKAWVKKLQKPFTEVEEEEELQFITQRKFQAEEQKRSDQIGWLKKATKGV